MIDSNVHELVGQWVVATGNLHEDDACRLINQLIRNHLSKIATSIDGWTTLYQDPGDGRYWELSYPQSELAGGGPPMLSEIDSDKVGIRYYQ